MYTTLLRQAGPQMTSRALLSRPNVSIQKEQIPSMKADEKALQDIVTASPNFDIDEFIPQLREYLAVLDLKQCMFLIRWITLLASVPDVDLLSHLPQLLGGLLDTMQNEWHEVRDAAGKALEVNAPHLYPADISSRACPTCNILQISQL